MADEYAEIGVSCVQVTCSPKDLEKLCVTWVTSGSGKQAACWLPRIYSTPSRSLARIRDSLRYALLDVVNEVTSFTSASQASDSECAYDSEPTQGDPSKLGPKETKDDPVHVSRSRAVSTWANSLRMVRLLILFCIQNPNYFIKQGLVAVLCLAFLGLGFIMSVRSGHHCPVQTSPLPVQAQSEVLDQANQILLAHYPGKLFEDSQEGVEGQGTTTSSMSILSVLNRYRAADVDGEAEPKMSLENERDHVKQDVEVGADVNADSSSLRDNIDYWLGWSGPLEIE
ncbi:hypothetical protein BDW59DRAFT_137302 [Aspergillus cavernicola]|uniref:Uncharacterized protein n=1 Tax=Aspergillus cavernicola TaxID=176166 RepID=A0ABR4J577_9EURO